MKKLLLPFLAISLFLVISSCSNEDMGARVTKLEKTDVLNKLVGRYFFYVDHAYRKIGDETIDLTQDSIYNIYRNEVFMTFREGSGGSGGYVQFAGGDKTNDPKYPAPARTFTLLTRIVLPTGMTYQWNETAETLEIVSSGNSSYFPMLKAGKKAVLQEIIMYNSAEESKNATIPEGITFTVDDTDPQLGDVKYTFILKPLWFYYREPGQQNDDKFVIFK